MGQTHESPPPSDAREATVTNHHILIVDDEPTILELIRDILELEGFRVLVAHNGAVALHQIKQRPVALVFTDLMMPQLDGIELARRLRGDPDTVAIPIVLMSAAMPPGVSDLFAAILHKPFPIEKVTQIVRQCLPGWAPHGARSDSGLRSDEP